MTDRTRRHLDLLALSHGLNGYARAREPDANASHLLVHQALSKAFAESVDRLRPQAGLEASLRADIDHGLLVAG